MTEERAYNVMTEADLHRKWVNLRHFKEMLSPFLSESDIDKLAKSEKPPFTRKTFRATYFDGGEVQKYIDKHLKGKVKKGNSQTSSPIEREKC